MLAAMATFEDLKRKLAGLPDGIYRVFTLSAAPATHEDLRELERQFGAPLPAEYAKLLAAWGALVVEVVEDVWPRPQLYEVKPSWQFWYGFRVYGVGRQVPHDLSLLEAWSSELRSDGLLPIVKRTAANFVHVLTRAGSVGTWAQNDPRFEATDGDVVGLILAEIESLEEGVRSLQIAREGTEELVKRCRAAGWGGPVASQAILGHLGAPSFPSRLSALLESVDDDGFWTLCDALSGLSVSAPPHREQLLERFRKVEQSAPAAFNSALALIDPGIEDRGEMEPLVRAFASRAGMWAKRAEPLLARWGAG
jgi:hypothetical protein